MSKPSTVVGTYTGTGAAINIQLGFVPQDIYVVNETDGDEYWQWMDGMTDGHAIHTSTAVAKITANGISEYAGTAGGDSAGFTIGTALSESAKVFRYRATRRDY